MLWVFVKVQHQPVCSSSRSRSVVCNVSRSGEPSLLVREGCREMGASRSENLLFHVFIKLFAIFIIPYVLRWILSFHICSRVMLLFSINVKLCVDCLCQLIELTFSLNCFLKVIINTYTLLTPCCPHISTISIILLIISLFSLFLRSFVPVWIITVSGLSWMQ